MYSELALTPAIFDEESQDDLEAWRDQLSKLNSAMFPDVSVWPVLISNLYDGSWSSHIDKYIKEIKDHRAKTKCIDIVTNIKKMLVVRPSCEDWPCDDDTAWCREAIATHAFEPIDRIISI